MTRRLAASVLLFVSFLACSGPPSAPSPGPVSYDPAPSFDVGPPAVLIGAGDIGKCGSAGPEQTARLLDALPGTVFTAGDLAYPHGRPEDFRNCYNPSWGRHRDRTRPAPGNHEYDASPVAAAYFDYYGTNAGPRGLGYYSYKLGSWHVVSLNSEVDFRAGGQQEQWLRSDLLANRSRCTAAYFHKPRFSSGPHGSNGGMQDLWRTLHEFGVEVVISAHDHLYERFAPQDASGRLDPRGIRQFVVGTGGAPTYHVRSVQPNSETRGSDWGLLKLTLFPTSYGWEFVPVAGASYSDSGTADCF